jgi:hypothetical protein
MGSNPIGGTNWIASLAKLAVSNCSLRSPGSRRLRRIRRNDPCRGKSGCCRRVRRLLLQIGGANIAGADRALEAAAAAVVVARGGKTPPLAPPPNGGARDPVWFLARRLKTANVGRFAVGHTRQPSQDGKRRSKRRCLANMRPEPVEGRASTGSAHEKLTASSKPEREPGSPSFT